MNSILRENNNNYLKADLTALILSYNEEKHLERCINSVKNFSKRIIVIDSFSNDRTLDICKKYEVEVFQNKFINHAKQINWGLENININTKWILRIDSDEIASENFGKNIYKFFSNLPEEVSGLSINLKLIFFKKEITFGGVFPQRKVRIWKTDKGKCDDSWMDEHINVEGKIFHFNEDLTDINLNDISWWINKHNNYATREAISFFLNQKNKSIPKNIILSSKLNKFFKFKVYYNFPIGIRAFILFIYRYILRLGFLNGWQGLVFHSLQGFFFRFLIDVKIKDIKTKIITDNKSLQEVIKYDYNIEI